jgi:hypothetical protein
VGVADDALTTISRSLHCSRVGSNLLDILGGEEEARNGRAFVVIFTSHLLEFP